MINKEYSNIAINTALSFPAIPMQLAKLIASQSAHETANFTSNNFIKDKNGFGYKFYLKSDWQLKMPGIHSTETDHYAAYPSFENSVKEVCSWILRRQSEGKFPRDLITIQTPEQYARLLKSCAYYGGKEEDYAKGLDFYLTQINLDDGNPSFVS